MVDVWSMSSGPVLLFTAPAQLYRYTVTTGVRPIDPLSLLAPHGKNRGAEILLPDPADAAACHLHGK